jgi:hypothetical protein
MLTFPAWIRIIFCQGPRQVINALTLYSVFRAKLDPTGATDVGSTLVTFFKKIAFLANSDKQQAVILSGMTFTLVIWVFGALSLILAMLFFVLFLWHYIPNADGGLSGYCEHKVEKRLAKIVSVKVNKAIEEEERKRRKADAKAAKNGEKPVGRQATLPTLFDAKSDDKLLDMPMLNRNDTMATLPLYSSRPGTPSSAQPSLPGFELDQLDQKRPFQNRTVTGSSTGSFGSNAPLMGNASDMGYGRSGSPAPSLPPLDTNGYPLPPQRTATANSQNSQWNRGPSGGPPRMPSAMGDRGYTSSPVSYDNQSPLLNSFQGQNSVDSYGRPMPRAVGDLRSNTPAGPAPSMGRRTPFDPNYPNGRSSPAPGQASEYGRNSPAPAMRSPTNGGYQAYNPNMRSASAAPANPERSPQYRNMTDPGQRGPPQGGDYFSNAPPMPRPGTAQSQNAIQRPGTAQSQGSRRGPGGNGSGSGSDIARLASPAPYNGGGTQSPGFGPVNGDRNRSGSPMYRR